MHSSTFTRCIPKTAQAKGLFETEIKEKNLKVSINLEVLIWCSRPGSNRYAFMGHGILSLFLKSLYKFIFLYIKPYKPNYNKNYKVFKL